VCADTGPAARDRFDLPIDGPRGRIHGRRRNAGRARLLADPVFRRGTEAHAEKRRAILDEVRRCFKTSTSWFSATVRYVSHGEVLEKTWEEIGNRCIECGGCTYVCPACTCFTVSDRQSSANEVERVRIWTPAPWVVLHAWRAATIREGRA